MEELFFLVKQAMLRKGYWAAAAEFERKFGFYSEHELQERLEAFS